MVFRDRKDAGQKLAGRLTEYAGKPDVVVLALPRGGVPVGYEVARSLGAPLDVFVVSKVGVPHHEELALGAVATGGVVVRNDAIVARFSFSPDRLEALEALARSELENRERLYRGGSPPLPIAGKTVVLVDDGVATGATMRAAIEAVRKRSPARVIVAVPVAPPSTCTELALEANQLVCAFVPQPFSALSMWYDDFAQIRDAEVRGYLEAAKRSTEPRRAPPPADVRSSEVQIGADGVTLVGDLTIPPRARGVVLFAHGSGSSRLSPRNRRVASRLQRHSLATLMLDLLTREEGAVDELTGEFRFDISLLANRLVAATDWMVKRTNLPLGYFGASTGAAAALVAAARRPLEVKAVVSRGGRPDLAGGRLERVAAPTLLIVGSLDETVLDLNRQAYRELSADRHLVVVDGASHLFEEPGALDRVADLACTFFEEHLRRRAPIGFRSAS
jgi:putative phosphoribosyl transferase